MMNKWYQCITCQKCELTGSCRHRTNAKSHLIESGLLPDKKMCFFPIQLTYYLLKALDLIVCLLKLDPKYENMDSDIELTPQEEEIEDIGWTNFTDFTNQNRWQGSPLYQEMHKTIHEAIEDSRDSSTQLKGEQGENSCDEKNSRTCGMIAKSLESK